MVCGWGRGLREESGWVGWHEVIGWNPVSLWWAATCKGGLPRWSHYAPILPWLPREEQRWKQHDWAMTCGGNRERAVCTATVPALLWHLLGNTIVKGNLEMWYINLNAKSWESWCQSKEQMYKNKNTLVKKKPYIDHGEMNNHSESVPRLWNHKGR